MDSRQDNSIVGGEVDILRRGKVSDDLGHLNIGASKLNGPRHNREGLRWGEGSDGRVTPEDEPRGQFMRGYSHDCYYRLTWVEEQVDQRRWCHFAASPVH